MITICSEQGYPRDNQILARVEYCLDSPSEGIILIVGKDGQGNEYRPKKKPEAYYRYPSGTGLNLLSNPEEKSFPALFFGFQLDSSRWQPEIIGDKLEDTEFNDDFWGKFDLTLMDENIQPIAFSDVETEREFKEMAVWGAYELRGLLRSHFWGEMYVHRSSALEKFLQEYGECTTT